jgi:hypothetical protein
MIQILNSQSLATIQIPEAPGVLKNSSQIILTVFNT